MGGDTSAGPIERMNDGGLLRLTVPSVWRGVRRRFAEWTEPRTISVKYLVWGWFTPKPGARWEIPIPVGAGQRRLGIRVAP